MWLPNEFGSNLGIKVLVFRTQSYTRIFILQSDDADRLSDLLGEGHPGDGIHARSLSSEPVSIPTSAHGERAQISVGDS